MNYYLIDFENVSERGLTEVSYQPEDLIYLFYTRNASKISLDVLADAESVLKFIRVAAGKQSLDMHLISYLGYLLHEFGKGQRYVVVSNDAGFDHVIQFWRKRGYNVARRDIPVPVKPQAVVRKEAPKAVVAPKPAEQPKKEAPKPVEQPKKEAPKPAEQPKKEAPKPAEQPKKEAPKPVEQPKKEAPKPAEQPKKEAPKPVEQPKKEAPQPVEQPKKEAPKPVEQPKKEAPRLAEPPVVKAAEPEPAEQPAPAAEPVQPQSASTVLNNKIMGIYSKNKVDSLVAGFIASLVVKNINLKDGKAIIYRGIVKQYGQKTGLNYYNMIKKEI